MPTTPFFALRAPRGAAVVVGVVLLGALLAACGTSNKGATATTTSTSSTKAASTGTAASSSSSGSSSAVSKIEALSSSLQGAETSSFKAVYSVISGGKTQSVTVEQSPPKSAFSTSGGTVIDTGTSTYYCTATTGQTVCLSAGTTNPLASLTTLFSPQTALDELKAVQADAATSASGYSVTFAPGSYGGQSTTCATVTGKGTSEKYCVTKQGVLAYGSSADATLSLTSFSSSPPASDFAIPAGATVETIPSGTP